MKSRETKQKDLNALTEELKNANSAMVVSFNKLTVTKDQEFRNKLRESGAKYQVVKNTLARIAVKDTQFEGASDHFKGVTALVWTNGDAVVLSKTVTKFVKDNKDVYTFKAGVVDGKVYDAKQVEAIASLPSKEELISKLLFVINAQAQRIATVINAVPRNLAVVIKQIGEAKGDAPAAAAEQKTEAAPAVQEAAAPTVEETAAPAVAEEAAAPAVEEAQPEATEEVSEPVAEAADATPAEAAETTEAVEEAAPAAEETAAPATEEAPEASEEEKSE